MAELLSLFNYQQTPEEFLPYLIVQSERPQTLQSLSSDIMQITESIYVIDLILVEKYWSRVASKNNRSFTQMIEQVVRQEVPDATLSLLCEHPFQGLVFFNHLKMHESRGFFSTSSLFAQKIYKNMGWHPWMLAARQAHDCFEAAHCLKKERKNFHGKLGQLQRFVERLDMQEFSGLQQAHFFEISRRFKGFIGSLWRWTFPEQQTTPEELTLFLTFDHYQRLQGFPWVPFFQDEPASQQTLLEHSVSDWGSLRESLFLDLEKLSRKPELAPPYKIVQMQWTLTLYDMSQVTETLFFKYPLSFEEEREREFETLLKQLQFCFEGFRQRMRERDAEIAMINTPLIVGWLLEVTKGFVLSEKEGVLDFEEQVSRLKNIEIQELDNKMKSSIQTFKVFDHFVSGLDYQEKGLSAKDSGASVPLVLDQPRPFYLSPEEEELSPTDIKSFQFLDRTSSDWWRRQDALDSYRDCYICELTNKSFVFAYRNYKGQWFQYGL